MKKPKPGPVGTHAFYGACAPPEASRPSYETFSVGCFEWISAPNGKTKRGPVKVRIKGFCDDPEAVYNYAIDVCLELDAGTYNGKKTIKVAP